MRLILFIILATCVIILPLVAFAQVQGVDEATREVDRDIREEAEKEMLRPPEKPPEIEEAEEKEEFEGPKFFVTKIELTGCESFPPEDFSHLVKKYENRDVYFEELNILAGEIQREYLRKGILAACFVPPQEIKEDGVVFLRVVEARMGKVEIQDTHIFNKKKTLSYWEVRPGKVIEYYKVSRSLQFMNKNPDREVRAALHAGEEPGTTDVYLSVDENFPIHFIYTFDREGTPVTGRARTGYAVKHNNFLGLDDTLLGGYMCSKNSDAFYAYHSIPVTNFGTTLLYGLSYSESYPEKDFAQYEMSARAENASMFLHQDLFKKDDYFGEFYFGMDAKDKTVIWNRGTLNRDRLRVFRVGAKYIHKFPGNATYIKPEFSQGLNFLGARRRNDLSSRGADCIFSKFKFDLQHRMQLPFNLQAHLNINTQLASEKLTPQEEFAMGGLNNIRGYPSGDYLADSALTTNLELLIPAFFIPKGIKLPFSATSLKDDITGVLFFDYGHGERRGKRTDEEKVVDMASIGGELRIRLYDQVLVKLALALPVGDNPNTEHCGWRFHISVEFEDKLHREFKRIRKSAKK